ncbi:probable inactive ribonuclease-like protein 12 [Cavia porcellus]
MLPVKAAAKITGANAIRVKGILTLMTLMVLIFLLLLFWEREPAEEIVVTSIEHLHVDYPKSNPIRYCNSMVLQRVIREPNDTCKKKHVFIHERPQKLNSVCISHRKMVCPSQSTIFCFQSETKFKMTLCQLIGGITYPACRYQVSALEGYVLVTCDNLGPVHFHGYIE